MLGQRLRGNLDRIARLLPTLRPETPAILVRKMAKARLRNDSVLVAVSAQLAKHADALDPQHIVMGMYGLGKFRFQDDNGLSMGLLASQARRHIWNYSLNECSQMLSSMARVKGKNPAFLTKVADRLDVDSVKSLSTLSLINLMTSFARLGTNKKGLWQLLADELSTRIQSDPTISSTDLTMALVAYAYPNISKPHQALFQSVSLQLLEKDTLSPDDIMRYIKACARVQYRDLETLGHCASSLRRDPSILPSLSKDRLLELDSNLDKLGTEMAEVKQGLSSLGISVNSRVGTPWFRRRAS